MRPGYREQEQHQKAALQQNPVSLDGDSIFLGSGGFRRAPPQPDVREFVADARTGGTEQSKETE